MSITLKIKKRVLSVAIAILVTGNVTSMFVPTEILDEIILSTPTFASSGTYVPTIVVEPEVVATYEFRNMRDLESKIEDMDLNKEHIRKIETYLGRRGAPLASQAKTFVRIAQKYNLPYNLMPAISIIESSGGLHNYRPYNYAGMGGQSNARTFSSYDEAIEFHASFIRRGYFDKGANTPERMERYYCPPCTTWGREVRGVMNSIDGM